MQKKPFFESLDSGAKAQPAWGLKKPLPHVPLCGTWIVQMGQRLSPMDTSLSHVILLSENTLLLSPTLGGTWTRCGSSLPHPKVPVGRYKPFATYAVMVKLQPKCRQKAAKRFARDGIRTCDLQHGTSALDHYTTLSHGKSFARSHGRRGTKIKNLKKQKNADF